MIHYMINTTIYNTLGFQKISIKFFWRFSPNCDISCFLCNTPLIIFNGMVLDESVFKFSCKSNSIRQIFLFFSLRRNKEWGILNWEASDQEPTPKLTISELQFYFSNCLTDFYITENYIYLNWKGPRLLLFYEMSVLKSLETIVLLRNI